MSQLAHITLVVRDYDEALAFYVGKLGFELVEDTPVPEQNKRWVTIRPPGAPPCATTILLARATTPEQTAAIGNQTGGRVAFFLAPTTSPATTPASPRRKSNGSARPPTSPMAASPSFATSTATSGI